MALCVKWLAGRWLAVVMLTHSWLSSNILTGPEIKFLQGRKSKMTYIIMYLPKVQAC